MLNELCGEGTNTADIKQSDEVTEVEKEFMETEQIVKQVRNCLPDGNFGDVMIVGGGISGIQASLDLATAGYKVYLVEKLPTIGGKMAQLDKTFPTNDCSMCIESPKFNECSRHPNIEILTYTEVDRVEGEAGDFRITLIKKPRYIIEDRCTGCTVCVEYCPVMYPDQFNQGISNNKAIHIYFAQATPLVTYIDESCLYLQDRKCMICLGVRKNDAINFNQKPEKMEINVGAIILAPGFKAFDPGLRDEFGYGKMQNVVTSMDYERQLCATGPYEGEILRASEKAKDIIRMSVARACHLEPLQEYDLPVNKTALVVGGGIAGITCALSIANQGHEVYLVEKDTDLGGTAQRIHATLEGLDVQAYLRDIIKKVYRHPLVHVSQSATILDVSGYVGNFVTRVKSEGRVREIKHGAAVIATGADEYKPTEYLYGKDDRVLTQLELEAQIAKGAEKVISSKSLVMIQCVGCRQEDRNYCSRICCSHAIKNALKLKEITPGMDIHILFRDMRTYGFREDYYREAADKGVRFIRYAPEDKPRMETVVEEGRPVLRITAPDAILGQELALDADLLALSVAVIPSATSNDIPYIKLVERERLRAPLQLRASTEPEAAHNKFFESDEMNRLFNETIVDKLAISQILLLLQEQPLSTGEISAKLGLNPSEIARHMSSSSRHGLVRYDESRKCFALA